MRKHFVELINPEGEIIADLGCGTGYTTLELLEWTKEGEIIGIDLSHAQMCKARRAIRTIKEDYRVHFILADVEQLPLRSNVASAVVSAGLVEFLPNPVNAYIEMRRVSKEGGKIAMLAPRLQKSPLIRVLALIMMHFWTEKEALGDLTNAGFREIKLYWDGPKWSCKLVLIAIAKK